MYPDLPYNASNLILTLPIAMNYCCPQSYIHDLLPLVVETDLDFILFCPNSLNA